LAGLALSRARFAAVVSISTLLNNRTAKLSSKNGKVFQSDVVSAGSLADEVEGDNVLAI
jgi:hypothetical protein